MEILTHITESQSKSAGEKQKRRSSKKNHRNRTKEHNILLTGKKTKHRIQTCRERRICRSFASFFSFLCGVAVGWNVESWCSYKALYFLTVLAKPDTWPNERPRVDVKERPGLVKILGPATPVTARTSTCPNACRINFPVTFLDKSDNSKFCVLHRWATHRDHSQAYYIFKFEFKRNRSHCSDWVPWRWNPLQIRIILIGLNHLYGAKIEFQHVLLQLIKYIKHDSLTQDSGVVLNIVCEFKSKENFQNGIKRYVIWRKYMEFLVNKHMECGN